VVVTVEYVTSPRALLAAATLTTALVAVPTAASAAPADDPSGGVASTSNVVLYDSCQHQDVSYTATIPALASLWRLQVQVFDPNGMTSEGLVANSARGDAKTGTFSISFCGSETPGTWTIRTSGFYELLLPAQLPLPTNTTTFTVRHAQTQTTLTRKAVKRGYRLVANVRQEQPDGWSKANGAQVRIQKLVGDQWVGVPNTVLATTHGRDAITVKLPRGTKVRAVTIGQGSYDGSTSAPVTLKRR
jgi:hypothetical protein